MSAVAVLVLGVVVIAVTPDGGPAVVPEDVVAEPGAGGPVTGVGEATTSAEDTLQTGEFAVLPGAGDGGDGLVEASVVGAGGVAAARSAYRGPVGPDVFPAEPAPLMPKPEAVRGIYLNAWAAGSSRRLAQLMKLAEETEINTFVIDVKEAGEVSYRSGVGLARAIGADKPYIPNVRKMLAELRSRGIYPIARIVVFKDPVLAEARPEWAIQHIEGTTWRDADGNLWVDPYNREVWDYNIALAREAVLLGFSEIQWDYVRFPDVPSRYMKTAVYPAQAGRSREQAIREFLRYSKEKLADLGVLVTADVFGLTVSVGNDMGIGQRWEQMADVTDALLPMVYPSHFAKGSYGIPVPNADPYQTVKTAMEFAIRRSRAVENAAAIRPWLQDFSIGWPSYGAAEVRAQIQATYDAGLMEWILWNPGSRYTAAALATKDGVAPDLPIPVHRRGEPPTAPADTGQRLLGRPIELDSILPDTVQPGSAPVEPSPVDPPPVMPGAVEILPVPDPRSP